MIESPDKNGGRQVRFTIYSGGRPIRGFLDVVSIVTFRAVNRIGRCTLLVSAGDMPHGEVPESELDVFDTGRDIRVEAGYGDDEKCIFDGMIVSHNLDIGEGNNGMLRIECRERSFLMTLCRRNMAFSQAKDSAIMKKIIGSYSSLVPAVDGTAYVHSGLLQYYCTDWDFILSRAEANGRVVITEGKRVSVKKPGVSSSPVLRVAYGSDVISFHGELLAENQWDGVEATGWDPAKQEMVRVSGVSPSLNVQGGKIRDALGCSRVLQTGLCSGGAMLQAWADGRLLRCGLSRIQGRICFYGSARAEPDTIISLDGFGKRFNGNAYLGSVEHEIRDGEWITTAGMGLPAEGVGEMPDVTAPAAAGLVPGIRGLHVGKVTRLEDDPDGDCRIEVRIPVLGNDSRNRVWARLSSGWAGAGFGAFFVPDVGDEVVLGFFNSDPGQPVVLGSLYSVKNRPPYALTAGNSTRGIVTREGMKLTFDEENKVIVLQAGGNSAVISGKEKGIAFTDQSGNRIRMDEKGVAIESGKDLILKAQGNVKIESGMATEIKASTNLKSEATNVETKAKAALKMQGSASAEISASGQTVVKGAMVRIN